MERPMQISVSSNVEKVRRELPRALRRQVPFATSQALNDTAVYWKKHTGPSSMKADIDRPIPWSFKGGLRYKRSNKRNLTAQVRVEANRWVYLRYQVNGGVQSPRGGAIPIQVTDAGLAFFKRNNYGNLRKGALARASKRKDTFWGTVGNTYGLWRRVGEGRRQLNLLAVGAQRTVYSPQWRYAQSVEHAVGHRFNRAFSVRMSRAIKNARL